LTASKNINQEEVLSLFDSGISYKDLAIKFECTNDSIIYILKKYNKWETPNRTIDISGMTFGWITVAKRVKVNNISSACWEGTCICGKKVILKGSDLRSGRVLSCGCKRPILVGNSKRKNKPFISSAIEVFRQRYSDGDLKIEQFISLSQMPCYYCGILNINSYNIFTKSNIEESRINGIFDHNGLDRIIPTEKHNINNVVPCCKWCNEAKMNRSAEEFFEHRKRMAIILGANPKTLLEKYIPPGDYYIKLVEEILSTNPSLEDLIIRKGFNKMEDKLILEAAE